MLVFRGTACSPTEREQAIEGIRIFQDMAKTFGSLLRNVNVNPSSKAIDLNNSPVPAPASDPRAPAPLAPAPPASNPPSSNPPSNPSPSASGPSTSFTTSWHLNVAPTGDCDQTKDLTAQQLNEGLYGGNPRTGYGRALCGKRATITNPANGRSVTVQWAWTAEGGYEVSPKAMAILAGVPDTALPSPSGVGLDNFKIAINDHPTPVTCTGDC